MEQRTRKMTLTAVVGLLALMCLFAMIPTSENFLEENRAYHGTNGVLINLELVDEDTVILTFRFVNESSLDLAVENIQFNLYVNREFVGNFSLRGRTLLPPGETDVEVEAKIDPHYLPKLESQLNSGSIHWFIYGGAVVELPFEKETFNISFRESWVSE